MIDIKLAFEKETGLDVMNPLGDITISDGSSSIVLNRTYLDSWLAALIAGYKRVRGANHVSVEVAEEPIALHVEVTPKGLAIEAAAEATKLLKPLVQRVARRLGNR